MSAQRRLAIDYDLMTLGPVGQPLSDDYLAAIKERCRKAQVGPWIVEWGKEIGNNWVVATGPGYEQTLQGTYGVSTDNIHASDCNAADGKDDAEFIAHARQDIPALLEEITRLRTELAKEWRR